MKKSESNVPIGGVIKEPGSSKSVKTGAWRNFRPIVTAKCIGCGTCAMFCPEGCIKIIDKKANIDYDYCKGCLICVVECPVKAIEKKQEEK